MKLSILVTTLLLSLMTYGNNCIPHDDLKEISNHFSQFNKFVRNKKVSYCEAQMGKEWFKIGKSLQLLKNMTPNEPTIDQQDGFTYKAISEKDWWSYFTKRAKKFSIKKRCQDGVVAFVRPFFGGGKINLCPFFFDFNVTSQASTMMHEVRHFDGHSHTRCTQGNENGMSGACDSNLTNQGSYAISVQTLVGMARSKDVAEDQKALVEAEAVYMAFNKFNKVPKLKINKSLMLNSGIGEVFHWDLNQNINLVKTLEEPSVIYASANYMTIYPENRNMDAYRTGIDLATKVEKPGLFAEKYNSESLLERDKYQSVSYLGAGGMLKDNHLILICDRVGGKMSNISLDAKGNFIRILTLSTNKTGQEHQNFLLSETGDLLSYECADLKSTKVKFGTITKSLSSDLADITQMVSSGDNHFALKESGEIIQINASGSSLKSSTVSLPIANQDWLSIAPITRPEVF